MVIAVILALVAILVFGDKIEKRVDDYLETVYRDHADKDALKTHFAIYGLAYWVGFIAFLCLPAMLEAIRDSSATYRLAMSLMLIVAFAILAKVTKMFYAVSTAREQALQKYLSE